MLRVYKIFHISFRPFSLRINLKIIECFKNYLGAKFFAVATTAINIIVRGIAGQHTNTNIV